MLGVDEDAPPLCAQEGHRVADHREVFLERGAQGELDVPGVRLGHEGDDGGTGVDERAHEGVVGSSPVCTPGRAEGRKRRVLELELPLGPGEELGVLGVGPRPATLDESHPEVVDLPCDRELVRDGEVEPLLLGTVAQGGVVDVEVGQRGRAGHRGGNWCRAGHVSNGFQSSKNVVALLDPVDRLSRRCQPQHRVARTNKKTPRGVGGLRDE